MSVTGSDVVSVRIEDLIHSLHHAAVYGYISGAVSSHFDEDPPDIIPFNQGAPLQDVREFVVRLARRIKSKRPRVDGTINIPPVEEGLPPKREGH